MALDHHPDARHQFAGRYAGDCGNRVRRRDIAFCFFERFPARDIDLGSYCRHPERFPAVRRHPARAGRLDGHQPAYESGKGLRRSRLLWGVALGTVFAGILYVLFVAGIFGSAARITPDTLSGIANWAEWKRLLLATLGLFAIGTGAVPITHEIRNALEKDMHWHPVVSRAVIIFLPLVVVLAGFNQFVVVLGLSGGCFIALQYLLILLVGRRVLAFSALQKFFLDAVSVVFILAAVYEVGTFVVH